MNDDEKYLLEIHRKRRGDRLRATTKRRRLGQEAPKPFADLLKIFFQKDPEALAQIEETKAIEAWGRFVGEAAARVSRASRARHGVLTVVVKDPVWMQELSFLKQGILARYREEFPRLGLKNIFFTRN